MIRYFWVLWFGLNKNGDEQEGIRLIEAWSSQLVFYACSVSTSIRNKGWYVKCSSHGVRMFPYTVLQTLKLTLF